MHTAQLYSGWDPATPPPTFGLIYDGAIGQLRYRRHLFVTSWSHPNCRWVAMQVTSTVVHSATPPCYKWVAKKHAGYPLLYMESHHWWVVTQTHPFYWLVATQATHPYSWRVAPHTETQPCYKWVDCGRPITVMVGSLKMNTTLEYSTRVVQEGDRRCKKSTLNDLAYLTPLRIPLMNPV